MPTARRSPLTRERVLRAAVRLADKHGPDALSMRRLAATPKVEAMSQYNQGTMRDGNRRMYKQPIRERLYVITIGVCNEDLKAIVDLVSVIIYKRLERRHLVALRK